MDSSLFLLHFPHHQGVLGNESGPGCQWKPPGVDRMKCPHSPGSSVSGGSWMGWKEWSHRAQPQPCHQLRERRQRALYPGGLRIGSNSLPAPAGALEVGSWGGGRSVRVLSQLRVGSGRGAGKGPWTHPNSHWKSPHWNWWGRRWKWSRWTGDRQTRNSNSTSTHSETPGRWRDCWDLQATVIIRNGWHTFWLKFSLETCINMYQHKAEDSKILLPAHARC